MTLPNSLARAVKLHANGDLLKARREAESALTANPANLAALRVVGVLYCQTGEPAVGVSYLIQALELAPGDLPTRVNAIQASLDAGRALDASRLGEEAPGEPTPQLLRLRAAAAQKRGHLRSAIEFLEQATILAPDDYAGWNNLGNALHDAGRVVEAVAALEQSERLKPNDPRVVANLGRALVSAGRSPAGIAALVDAVTANPNDARAHFELAQALRLSGDRGGALRVIGKAAQLDRANADIFAEMGVIFGNLNDLTKSEQAYRMALSIDPAHPRAYLNFGIILEQANRLEELRALLTQAARPATNGDERRFLGSLLMRREGKHAEALQLALATEAGGSVDENTRAHLIGQLADRLEKPALAFDSFVAMHRSISQSAAARRYDGTEARRGIEEMAKVLSPDWIESWQAGPSATSKAAAPVFLIGFLRSGTTLLDTMMMGHPEMQVLEEEPILTKVSEHISSLAAIAELDADAVSRLRALYFEEVGKVAKVAPDRLLVDKNPLASLRAPLIHRLFPDARFIFALRHPCDVVLSCFMQNFKINQAMASFLTLENAARYYDAVMSYWIKCQELLPLNVHVIRYEALVADREPELRALMAFLGLPWRDELLAHEETAADRGYIRTPSYAQVTEGIYARAKGRWERYREQLQPIMPILAPWVERFGYEPLRDA